MRFNNKKFIYLISPLKINKFFYKDLIEVLKHKKVGFFQLRLKNYELKKKLLIGKKTKKICKKFNVKFLVNDDVYLAKKLNADGCHLGQRDMSISEARNLIGEKIIGITIIDHTSTGGLQIILLKHLSIKGKHIAILEKRVILWNFRGKMVKG